MTVGTDGTIFMGESGRRGNLFLYLPDSNPPHSMKLAMMPGRVLQLMSATPRRFIGGLDSVRKATAYYPDVIIPYGWISVDDPRAAAREPVV